jgi:hypothetical protein
MIDVLECLTWKRVVIPRVDENVSNWNSLVPPAEMEDSTTVEFHQLSTIKSYFPVLGDSGISIFTLSSLHPHATFCQLNFHWVE